MRTLALTLVLVAPSAFADDTLVTYTSADTSAPAPYVEYLPPGYSSSTTPERLLIFFHGMGESGGGTDATDIFNNMTANGPLRIIRNAGTGAHRFQSTQRAIVLAPRNPSGLWNGALASQFFGWAIQNYRVDPDFIYVTGISAGGGPTWAVQKDYPGKVAAVLPICPVQQIWPVSAADAVDYRNIAVWAFHGYGDPMVPKDESVRWINSIGQAISRDAQFPSVMTGYTPGGDQTAVWTPTGYTWSAGIGSSSSSSVRYTLLDIASHSIWSGIYGNNSVWTWLFAQRRSANVDPGAIDAGVPDAGTMVDAGSPDAGSLDAGVPDAGSAVDAGSPDAGGEDAGTEADGGETEDAGLIADAGAVIEMDAGAGDAGAPAEEEPQPADSVVVGGCSTGMSSPLAALLLIALVGRRRRSDDR
jgi:Synergist-CTERM protein sorting domain-containing protein